MLPQLEIYVDGKGTVFRSAERAYLRLSISASGIDQAQAFHDTQNTVIALTNSIRALATKTADGRLHPDAAITAFTVTPLSTMTSYQRDMHLREVKELPRHHTVSASAEVIFRDMDQLSNITNQLAVMPHVSILGAEWRLTDVTQAEIECEARSKAIKDAVQKAQDYAAVVGRQIIAVEIRDHLAPTAEPGTLAHLYATQAAQRPQQQLMQQATSQLPAATRLPLPSEGSALEPKTITVSAHIKAKFISLDDRTSTMEPTI